MGCVIDDSTRAGGKRRWLTLLDDASRFSRVAVPGIRLPPDARAVKPLTRPRIFERRQSDPAPTTLPGLLRGNEPYLGHPADRDDQVLRVAAEEDGAGSSIPRTSWIPTATSQMTSGITINRSEPPG